MSLIDRLRVLRRRIELCADVDAGAAQALLNDLAVVVDHARSDVVAWRVAEILLADFELLNELERKRPRRVPSDAEVIAAVEQHGGVRAAARALNCDPATVSRRLKKGVACNT